MDLFLKELAGQKMDIKNKTPRKDTLDKEEEIIVCTKCYDSIITNYDGDPDWFVCKRCKSYDGRI